MDCQKRCCALTSGKSELSEEIKAVMDFAVPGIVVCMVNKRCIAVDVKKSKIIIMLMLRV